MNILDFILHIDKYLTILLQTYGNLVYVILFLIIFAETGLVIMPFLPGDSLLFGIGMLAASGSINITILFISLVFAAILGDSVNYWIGNKLGPAIIKKKKVFFIKKEYIEKTEKFYAKYGGKTIILARFVPIIRTFAPFMAGVGSMDYRKFLTYNVIGGLAWISMFLFSGYLFGNIPIVKDNFSVIVIAIIVVSLVPIGIEYLKHLLEKRKAKN
jgi:membrane-associated protein